MALKNLYDAFSKAIGAVGNLRNTNTGTTTNKGPQTGMPVQTFDDFNKKYDSIIRNIGTHNNVDMMTAQNMFTSNLGHGGNYLGGGKFDEPTWRLMQEDYRRALDYNNQQLQGGGGGGGGLNSVFGAGMGAQTPSTGSGFAGNGVYGMQSDYNAQFNQLRNQAREQARQLVMQQQKQYQQLINSLLGQQDTALKGIEGDIEGAKQGLEDRYFQEYLRTRQAMANRGLAGSGVDSDQNTRLLMSKQRDLAGVYKDANQRSAEIRDKFGGQIGALQSQMDGINEDTISEQIYQQMYAQALQQQNERDRLALDYYKATLPYERATMSDMLNYQLGQDKLGFNYYDRNMSNQEFNNKLQSEYNIKMTDIMGYDQNGNPTLNTNKLLETMRHNKVTEQNARANINLGYARLNEQVRNNNVIAQLKAMQLQNTQWQSQGTMLNNAIKAKGQAVSDIRRLLEKDPNNAELKKSYTQAMNDYQAHIEALNALSEVSVGSSFRMGGGSSGPSTMPNIFPMDTPFPTFNSQLGSYQNLAPQAGGQSGVGGGFPNALTTISPLLRQLFGGK